MKIKNISVCAMFALIIFGFSLTCFFGKKEEFSVSERRPLKKLPELNATTVFDGSFMSGFEGYATDNFPMRDNFRALKAATALNLFQRQQNNNVYTHNGHISALEYPFDKQSVDKALERFGYITQKYLSDTNTAYISVIPDKNMFMADKSGRPSLDYPQFFEYVNKNSGLEYIDIKDTLQLSDYYATDTHWKQECIVDTAKKLGDGLGVQIHDGFDKKTLENGFYGVYAGQYALPATPDKLTLLYNDAIRGAAVFDYQNNKAMDMYDLQKADGKDPYETYLGGPLSLVTIDNPTATTDKSLVLFRDSFGSSIAPLLASGYKKITLVDIRYIHPDVVDKFVSLDNSDFLFLYSTMVLNNSELIK